MPVSIHKLLLNSAYLLAGNLGVAAISFLQGIIVARALGPGQYGVWAVIGSWSGLSKSFLGFRTTEPLTMHSSEAEAAGNKERIGLLYATAIATDLLTSLASLLVLAVAAFWIRLSDADEHAAKMAYAINAAALVFGFADSAWYSLARSRKDFRLLAIQPGFLNLARLAGVAALWSAGRLDLMGLSLLTLLLAAMQAALSIAYVRRGLRSVYGIRISDLPIRACLFRRGEIPEFWAFMRSTYFSSMASTLVKNADVILIGHYRSNADAGLYRLAKSLSSVLQSVTVSLTSVIYQDFNDVLRSLDIRRTLGQIGPFAKAWVPAVVLITALSIALSGPAISLVYGKAFAPAAGLFDLLMIGSAALMMFFWAQPLILAMGLHVFNMKLVVLISILGFAAMPFAARYGGSRGLAWAVSLMWVAMTGGFLARLGMESSRVKPA